MINTHPDTGVAYGLVSANDLDPELVDTLLYGPQAKDMTMEAEWAELLARTLKDRGLESEDELEDLRDLEDDFASLYQPYEPEITGNYDGVTYSTCWLGGALSFWILKSPHVGAGSCPSPCVPGACILHHPDDGEFTSTEGYTVPTDWWATREVNA